MASPSDTPAVNEESKAADAPDADGVSRRRFLVGAGVVAGTAAAAVAASAEFGAFDSASPAKPPGQVGHGSLDAVVGGRVPRLSIGFISGSSGSRTLAEAIASNQSRSVPAADGRSGALNLSGQALRVGVLGLTPKAADALVRRRLHVFLDALLPVPGVPDAVAPYFAWSFRPAPTPTSASPTVFGVPAARSHRLALRLEASTTRSSAGTGGHHDVASEAAVAGSATQILTSGFGAGLAKLRAGLYLVGIDHDHWDKARSLPALDSSDWHEVPSLVVSIASAKS